MPERFIVSRGTLRWDRFMNSVIVFGGIGIVVAVFGIFAFILLEITPLFQKARIEAKTHVPLAAPKSAVVGLDEWSQMPFSYAGGDKVNFRAVDGTTPVAVATGLPAGSVVSATRFDAQHGRILLGTETGEAGFLTVTFGSAQEAAGARVITPEVKLEPLQSLTSPPMPGRVLDVDYADSGDRKLYAAVQALADGKTALLTMTLRQKKSLMGKGKVAVDRRDDLTPLLGGAHPAHVLVPGTADSLLVLTQEHELIYLYLKDNAWELRQRFKPFDGAPVGTVDFLFGDVSVVSTDTTGQVRIHSLYNAPGGTSRTFGLTQEFKPLDSGATYYQASRRNKSFIVGNGKEVALCYATTGDVRKKIEIPFQATAVAIDSKAEHLGLLDGEGSLHLYEVSDPHPEASFQAFFGKVWYEGYSKPGYEWQSTSGTDDFEPKFSLIPLIVGSLKGTLFALLFAIPVALLAAVYTSQFLDPGMKRIVKPAMEMMASLPSVVLGFLAALWLAPLIENRVPSMILLILAIPLSAVILGSLWGRLPIHTRNRLPKGGEYMLLAPMLALLGWAGWQLGPWLEQVCFVATMPDGTQVADFRLWWPQFSGLPFEQRNGLVVGLVVGFAVIPVIFTIAEDALSSVPPSLTSASEALGASRWQVVRTVVLPIASAGIFSAVMIGLGRAVGETMIVVMATGNTAIFDPENRWLLGDPGIGGGMFPLADHWNPFNGMRTLSANIAVELPEAAEGSTHFRTLFLCAFLLFGMTFVLNTAAEVLRHKLREKFKIV